MVSTQTVEYIPGEERIWAYRVLATQCNNSFLDLTLCGVQPVKERNNILSFLAVYPLFLLMVRYMKV